MSEDDEFAAFDIDVAHLPYITALPPSPATPVGGTQSQAQPQTPTRCRNQNALDAVTEDEDETILIPDATIAQTPKSAVSDDFAAYDLSEFTAEDLQGFDQRINGGSCSTTLTGPVAAKPISVVPDNIFNAGASCSSTPSRKPSAGPAIDIQVDKPVSADYSRAEVDQIEDPVAAGLFEPPLPEYKRKQPMRPYFPPRAPMSPFRMFRGWASILAVTDLVAPTWCEYQFEYGLRQKRSKKLEDRPESFTTAQGKVIKVDKDTAKVNDKVLTGGKSVHKALEREIRPEEVPVEVATGEERWAIRIVKMIDCVHDLLSLRRCREMPVFGIVHDQLVVGVIDEVVRLPVPSKPSLTPRRSSDRKRNRPPVSVPTTPRKTKPNKMLKSTESPSSHAQLPLTSFFPAAQPHPQSPTASAVEEANDFNMMDASVSDVRPLTPPPPDPVVKSLGFRLCLSDTKTRRHPTLPQPEDTLSARLQLMLYRRLLCSLLAPLTSPEAVNSSELLTRMRLSPTKKFSANFIKDTTLPEDVDCLEKLEVFWKHTAELLNVQYVDESLVVEYRIQRRLLKRNRHKKIRTPEEQERDDLDRAISASFEDPLANVSHGEAETTPPLEDSKSQTVVEELSAEAPTPGSLARKATELVSDQPTATIVAEPTEIIESPAKSANKSDSGIPPELSSKTDGESDTESGTESIIIGTKTFQHNDASLDTHLDDILQWWHGKRPPRGVDITLTRRCRTCEYREGCEWREQKAEEIRIKQQEKKAASAASVL